MFFQNFTNFHECVLIHNIQIHMMTCKEMAALLLPRNKLGPLAAQDCSRGICTLIDLLIIGRRKACYSFTSYFSWNRRINTHCNEHGYLNYLMYGYNVL